MSTVMAEVAVCEEATRPACEPARTADLDDDPEDEGKQPVKPTQQVSAQNTDAQAIDQDNDDERRRLATDTKQPSSAAPSDSQSSRSSSRSKSDNCSSEATTASGKADDSDSGALSARRQSTTSRFKEKRPEPLKLNSNLNQDIPLDLSVKSAGVMPSGTLSSIFNLGGPFNPFAPLETPRIQWQDNCDSLLNSAKSRLFSSSTTASSNRARVSSIMGESPPITPNSGDPLMGAMFSSATNTSLRLPSDPPHSASLALESPLHSFLTSPFDLNSKLQLLDRLTQQPASGKHNYMLDQVRADLRGTPRRSCSTDNLQMFVNNHQTIASLLSPNQIQVRVKHDHHDKQSPSYNATLSSHTGSSKKNSISPLATKSLSNRSGSGGGGGEVCSPTTKFPYTSHQANTNTNDSQSSPTSNGKSLTPTSVTNATLNLYNIHLNSPNSNSRQSPIQNNNTTTINRQNTSGQVEYKSPSFSNFDHLDLFQNQVSVRRNASSSSSNGFDHISGRQQIKQHYQRQQSNPSISSTATLNTPTLISPSQLKAGQLCFLPSPTLSPMSSVFDLPSPLLMFAPSSSSAQASNQQLAVGEMNKSVSLSKTSSQNLSQQSAAKCADTTKKVKYDARQADKNLSLRQDNNRTARGFPINCTSDAANNHLSNSNEDCFEASATVSTASRNNLSQLITSAEHKTPANAAGKFGDQDNEDLNHDIEMDIINEPAAGDTPRTQTAIGCEPSGNQIETDDAERPSTVIPQICISDHQRGPYDLQENQPQHLASAQAKLGKTSHATNNLLNQLDCMNNGRHSREQRAQLCKRSLSPKTFHARVKNYQNERLESCSAPPDVQQRRRRSKIKTAADSCFELGNGEGTDKTSRLFVDAPSYAHENNRNGLSHSAADLVHSQQDGRLDRPGNGMETRGWLTASNQQLDARSGTTAELSCGENPFLSGRSSSAEPAVFSEANTFSNSTHLEAHNSGNGIAAVIPSCQSAGQLYMSGVQANSTCSPHYQNQQVHIHHHHQQQQQQQSHQQQQPSHTLQSNDNHSRSSYNQPHHHQQQYHSLANQQFQYQQLSSQALNYEQQTTYNAHQLYSMSASELHRLHYSSRGPTQAQAALANKNESTPFAQQSIPHYGQSFSHQNVQLPSDGHSGNHRVCANRQFVQDPDRSHDHAGPASHSANSIIRRQMSLQPMAAQLLNRSFESCGANQLSSQQEMSARKGLIEPINGLAPIGGHQGGQMRVYHQPEVESRSESRSSCSLDFVGSFAGSNSSRSNSAAGSNLAAKKYHCDQCSKSFTRSDMLTRHRRLHSGDRPFQCTECKQEFSRSDHLSTHMRTHTGEKPYKCKLCTYSACRKDMITRHLKVHNRSGAETGRSYMS